MGHWMSATATLLLFMHNQVTIYYNFYYVNFQTPLQKE